MFLARLAYYIAIRSFLSVKLEGTYTCSTMLGRHQSSEDGQFCGIFNVFVYTPNCIQGFLGLAIARSISLLLANSNQMLYTSVLKFNIFKDLMTCNFCTLSKARNDVNSSVAVVKVF